MFKVYLTSMQMRYFMELILFSALAVTFQYFISVFNDDLHKVRKDLDLLHWMEENKVS